MNRGVKQGDAHRVDDQLEVVELSEQRDAELFDRQMHGRVTIGPGQENDTVLEARRRLHDPTIELQPVHSRHQDIADDRVGRGVAVDQLEGLSCRGGLPDVVAAPLEEHPHGAPHRGIIVYYQNIGHFPKEPLPEPTGQVGEKANP